VADFTIESCRRPAADGRGEYAPPEVCGGFHN